MLNCTLREKVPYGVVVGLVLGMMGGRQAWAQKPATTATPDTLRRRSVQLGEVVVAASRVEESILQSPVTVEKLNARALRLTPAPSFFDALEGVKGVQVLTPSLGFKVLNARGFANTTNVRFVQLVDGMDQQAPHIGGPIGNVLGPSDLDIASVEVVPGTAAALYGLNAINGLANFSTRNPFSSAGLSGQQKAGLNHLNDPNDPTVGVKAYSETSLRYARVLLHRLAVKVNGTYSRGYDWIANDQTELNPNGNATTGLLGARNPARDPVNGYGNESSNRIAFRRGGITYSVARTGYDEQEVVDYQLQTIKADAALHYKLGSAELAYTYRLAVLDNVYQRSNRFRLQNYRLQQHALQLLGPVVQARAYLTRENTGQSYNLRSMAENLDRSFKPDAAWIADYGRGYDQAIAGSQTVAQAHAAARALADAGRYQPGTAPFNEKLGELQNINNWDQGAALRVQADLAHAEAQVNIAEALRRGGNSILPANVDLLAGADHRTYIIVPDGNYFINPARNKDPYSNLMYAKTGGFVQAGARFFAQKVRLTATLRADKNDYFNLRFNPRFTAVYSPLQQHSFRVSYQSGYRFPSLFEGFSNVNSGQVKRIGGLRVMSDAVFENSYLRSSIDAFNTAVTAAVNANTSATLTPAQKQSQAIAQHQGLLQRNPYAYLRPERIRSLEMGYKAALLPGGRLGLDVDFYYNAYRDFIAQVEAYVPKTLNPDSAAIYLNSRDTQKRYRLWTNARSRVYNYGGSLGLRYEWPGGLLAGANATYARLARTESGDGLEDGFNTPRWMLNLSLGHEKVYRNLGFGLSYHWQQRYYSQTFLVSGEVPAYGTLDAQMTYTVAAPELRFKLGATNVLNHYYTSFLGGPGIGGLYYLSVSCVVK